MAYAQSHNGVYDHECASHSDCDSYLPFCYDGHCDLCTECHYCHDGVDGTCGNCGAGFPTREDKQYGQEDVMTEDEMEMEEELFEAKMAQEEKEQLGFPTIKGSSAKSAISETADNLECAAHSDCESNLPFCYDGECAPCSECHYCHDGIDGTCGECGRGYPTVEDRSTYVGQYTKSWREFYACEYEDMTSEEIVIDALRKGGMSEIDIAKVTQNKGLSANSYSAKTVNSKAMEDEFIAAENAKEKENSYSAKSSMSKAMGDDMSEYRKIIQAELDEEGDSETEAEMESQLKVIAELANEQTSSAKALGDSKSKYRDVSSTTSSVSTVDDTDAHDKDKYKRLIRKQLDEENEDETDEEMDANVKIVMELAKEAATKKGKKTKSVMPTDIESKVIAALRNAGKVKPEGMSESDIAIKIMEGLDGLVKGGEE